ncbi:MAG: hypothetical protein Q9182_004497 [Xanthomendoza sp. 2 TL-2023]
MQKLIRNSIPLKKHAQSIQMPWLFVLALTVIMVKWSSVPVRPPGTEGDEYPPILVNVGDLLSYWTNGFLKSTVHRVVFPPSGGTSDRMSMAYFCHPVNATKLTPVPSQVVSTASATASAVTEEAVADSGALTAEEHLRSRLAATYGWNKETDREG